MEQPATAGGRCPICGAGHPDAAVLCTFCGSPLGRAPEAGAPPTERGGATDASSALRTAIVPQAAPDALRDIAASAPGDDETRPADSGPQKRCAWCGAQSAESNPTCGQCGAAFPRPEQDDAMLRASQERIRLANDSIDLMRKERTRKGIGRLFGR